MIGKTLSHYQIISQLGKGGMGEVYQATDTKLGRSVAIKVLPEEFARDADRVARFQREAKLLASLNHPNIAAIYGLEESEGTNFLVMELIEGQTLAERIKTGAIPVEESLKLALQIAEALEAAHEKGVIHRDLKPANIKVTPDGKVKVLDFGLAKAFAGDHVEVNLSQSPTLSDMATQQGVILGTAAYMSPEQARGKEVDKRADIWAFGVVLFEMLTGKPLFSGEDVSSTLARVLEREPDFSSLPANLHTRIRLLLERCLNKNPKDRYSGISDARFDIQEVLADPKAVLLQNLPQEESKVGMGRIWTWLLAFIIMTVIIIVIAFQYGNVNLTSGYLGAVCLEYLLPENQQFSSLGNNILAISPDGSRIAYTTNDGLYLRALDAFKSTRISGTEGKILTDPFFSYDGQWIGYYEKKEQRLMKIPLKGGSPELIAESLPPNGPIWDYSGTIFYSQFYDGILSVTANGGIPERIAAMPTMIMCRPRILPDGKTLLYNQFESFSAGRIVALSLESGNQVELLPGCGAEYLPTGHILYESDNNLFINQFDPKTLKVSGKPVRVIEGILGGPTAIHYAISKTGTLAYIQGTSVMEKTQFILVDRDDKEMPCLIQPDFYGNYSISPDGNRLACVISRNGNDDIWIGDLDQKTLNRLTYHEAQDDYPLWTSDGKWILFSSERNGSRSVYRKAADGREAAELLFSIPDREIHPWSISRDGKTILLTERGNGTGFDIGSLSIGDEIQHTSLLNESYNESSPQISPDENWLAYESNESGQWEIYLRPFSDIQSGEIHQVSSDGGEFPVWAPNGKELFYVKGNIIMAVQIETTPTVTIGNSIPLFTRGSVGPGRIVTDGKRFLLLKVAPTTNENSVEESPHKINIITNWFEELKEKVLVD